MQYLKYIFSFQQWKDVSVMIRTIVYKCISVYKCSDFFVTSYKIKLALNIHFIMWKGPKHFEIQG